MKLLIGLSILCLSIACSSQDSTTTETQQESTLLTDEETAQWLEVNLDSVMEKKVFTASNGMEMPYRLFVSPSYDGQTELPLLIFLHGRGDRGTDNRTKMFGSTRLFTNNMSIVSPNMQAKYPCIILVPQCSDKTTNEEWAKWVGNTPETPFMGLGEDGSYQMAEQPSESGAAALELIDSTMAQFAIDKNRVYLTGTSMGGFGTWEFAARRPELFAVAVPMAGYSDPSQVERIKHIPTWIFHGNIDKSNPVQGSRTMYELLEKAGSEVKYTEYDSVDHGGSFRMAFDEPDLIPWIFAQKKGAVQ